jgi:branched-chain amino acid transport system ATP-binding protein
MNMWFSISDLWVYYGKVAAVRGLSMGIEKEEIVTLIGANGAGKTTLLRTVSGLKKSTKGTIHYQNEQIDGKPPEKILKKGIAHVPEGRRVFPFMSVFDNLFLGAYARRDKEETEKDLQKVFGHFPRLMERLAQRAGSLSGGEQQMLAIGRALMSRPLLLLLDEPSLGLAPLMVAEVGRIIKDINKNGVTIILVEQNANMALKVAQRGYVMITGEIILSSDTSGLMGNEHVKRAYLGI